MVKPTINEDAFRHRQVEAAGISIHVVEGGPLKSRRCYFYTVGLRIGLRSSRLWWILAGMPMSLQ